MKCLFNVGRDADSVQAEAQKEAREVREEFVSRVKAIIERRTPFVVCRRVEDNSKRRGIRDLQDSVVTDVMHLLVLSVRFEFKLFGRDFLDETVSLLLFDDGTIVIPEILLHLVLLVEAFESLPCKKEVVWERSVVGDPRERDDNPIVDLSDRFDVFFVLQSRVLDLFFLDSHKFQLPQTLKILRDLVIIVLGEGIGVQWPVASARPLAPSSSLELRLSCYRIAKYGREQVQS